MEAWARKLNPISDPSSLTLLLFVLAVLKLGHASNLTDESRLQRKWLFPDSDGDFYDDDPDQDYAPKPASSYLSMLKPVKPAVINVI